MGVAVAGVALETLIAQEVLNNAIGAFVSQILSIWLSSDYAGLQEELWKLNPTLQLNVADVTEAVIKGHFTFDQGAEEASLSGIKRERFQKLVDTAGEPIPLLTAMEAWRRGFIPATAADPNAPSLEKAIRDSRLKNVWFDTVKQLQYQLPPVGTIIEGWLRAQITEAQALDLANKAGVDKATATLMFKSAGRPPAPAELLELWRRGIIPEKGTGGDAISFDQGYLETDLKDKWLPIYKRLFDYVPPPRIVTALLREGAITEAEARAYFKDAGLDAKLQDIYVASAHHQRSAATKELTKAELVSLYVDQAITSADLSKRLLARGFVQADIDLEIELADLKVAHALEQRAVNRVGTLYVGRKIDKALAMSTLQGLKLPQPQIDRLLTIWTLERGDNLKHLTAAEIGDAVKYGFWTGDQAMAEMTVLGYGARDAWIVLSDHLHTAVTPTMPTDNLPPV